jgi:hypothetical protein
MFAQPCPYKPITCQERDGCKECGIYLAKFYPERLEVKYADRKKEGNDGQYHRISL